MKTPSADIRWSPQHGSLNLTTLRRLYLAGELRATEVVEAVYGRLSNADDDAIFLHLAPRSEVLRQARQLERRAAEQLERMPLYGIPFAVKDNIDVAGMPTTAACPSFSFTPSQSSEVVRRLIEQGALCIGKTNMDQFATGLVGIRTPYGKIKNPFHPEFVPGGSSSGSAVAVSRGLVSFSLGTDTAGSGRVPAAFNNIVGLKPSRGLLSASGTVPACRSFDCISVFTLTADDARAVFDVARGYDPADPFARAEADGPFAPASALPAGFRVGIPQKEHLQFFGDPHAPQLYERALAALVEMGGEVTEIDFAPFAAAARLLYEGPFVAERLEAAGRLLALAPGALFPVTRQILESGMRSTALDVFQAFATLNKLRREAAGRWAEMDILALPTTGTIYRISEVEANPIELNSRLGHYTNFVNLLDTSAIALPGGFRPDGLPLGVTLIAPAMKDDWLCALGSRFQRKMGLPMGATTHELPAEEQRERSSSVVRTAAVVPPPATRLAVVGAHLSGMPLNHELTQRGAHLVRTCRTAPSYRLFTLAGSVPSKPGLVRDAKAGYSIEVEVWEVPTGQLGGFIAGIMPPLCIGTLTLDDQEQVKGFLCEAHAVVGAEEISEFGGWRAYREAVVGS